MRVIAGKLGGLPLDSVRGTKTRPTSDRVKESVFSILMPHIPGATVLDLYSGSGALAIEALSRGAERALLVDDSAEAIAVIRRNLERTGLGDVAEVWRAGALPTLRRLARAGRRFDLIFADPPYDQGLARATLDALDGYALLTEAGRIIIEHSAKEEMPQQAQNFTLTRQRAYGDTLISLFCLTIL